MKRFARARSESAKKARRAAIVRNACEIIDEEGFAALTMESVAQRSKLAKASVYGYFQSREELLITVLREDFESWFILFREFLAENDRPFSSDFAQLWVESVQRQPRLPTALTYLHVQLESNISLEFAEQWKSFLLAQIKETHYVLLAQFKPVVSLGLLIDLFVSLTGVTIGFWAQSQSTRVIQKVFEKNPELAQLKVDFAMHMGIAIEALLKSPKFQTLASISSLGAASNSQPSKEQKRFVSQKALEQF